jgi:hypothetical protein
MTLQHNASSGRIIVLQLLTADTPETAKNVFESFAEELFVPNGLELDSVDLDEEKNGNGVYFATINVFFAESESWRVTFAVVFRLPVVCISATLRLTKNKTATVILPEPFSTITPTTRGNLTNSPGLFPPMAHDGVNSMKTEHTPLSLLKTYLNFGDILMLTPHCRHLKHHTKTLTLRKSALKSRVNLHWRRRG